MIEDQVVQQARALDARERWAPERKPFSCDAFRRGARALDRIATQLAQQRQRVCRDFCPKTIALLLLAKAAAFVLLPATAWAGVVAAWPFHQDDLLIRRRAFPAALTDIYS